jgi:TrmH family RNA methyltransferase
MKIISSKENKTIKLAKSLHDKKYRKRTGLMIVEGQKIIEEARKTKQVFVTIFVQHNKYDSYKTYLNNFNNVELVFVTESVLKHISPTKTPQGILALIKTKVLEAKHIDHNFLVLDNVQDPGNLGAILRSAAATGFLQVFMLNCVDVTSDKVVRASMGNLFRTQNYNVSKQELISVLNESKHHELYVANMNGQNVFHFKKPNKHVGIVIGNEGSGVSEWLKNYATNTLSIPMLNEVESLNAAVSASILMYQLKK